MKFFKEGEKSKAICSDCKKLVPTTFRVRSVPIANGKGSVPDVLVGVCDICDFVVSLPQQSAPKVAETLRKKKKDVEARIPIHVKDMALQILLQIGLEPNESYLPILLNHFVLKAEKDKFFSKHHRSLIDSDFLNGKKSGRISMKMNHFVASVFDNISKKYDLGTTELVEALLIFMQKEVLEKPNGKEIANLKKELIVAS